MLRRRPARPARSDSARSSSGRSLRKLAPLAALAAGLLAADTASAQVFRRNQPQRTTPRVSEAPAPAQQGGAPAADAVARAEQKYRAGDYDGVVQETDAAVRENARNHQALYFRGSAKVELGLKRGDTEMIREGIADAREAISLGGRTNSKYYLPYLYGMTNLGMIEAREEHATVSVNTADTVLAREDLDADTKGNLLYQRALAKRYLKQYDAAVEDFTAALEALPNHLASAAERANTMQIGGTPEQAREAFDQMVAAFPENPLVYNNRGMYLLTQQDLEGAVADFTRALDRNPNYHYALTNRGKAALDQGDTTAAIADFNRSLQVNPNQPGVYGFRGNAKLFAGDLSGAVADQQTAVQQAPTNPVAHSDLGFVLFFSGDYAEALEQFDAALRLNPGYRHLHPWRLESLIALNRDGSEDPGVTLALDNGGNGVDWVVRLLQFQLDRLTAEELLGKITDEDERAAAAQRCEAHYFIGRDRLRAGDESGAQEAFRVAVETDQKQLSAYRGSKIALGE
ncbi:tetratricopeptide repeat protein [Alienimonas californiensis]|uniref:Lipoprotein NlpI n=1 Tax=Alienimonas californiensis TaxID=2527989 RepID=A0A517PF09_9PLAN|nr:tetratricopeptide repeat protein [Alienimonas californiensis]QDT17960.1 lipoprotein NlpI [Alienimonas californiensis]